MTATTPTYRSASAGFTLIEVLMALLVMTVGLLGLLQSLQVAYQHSARNRLRDEAVQIAEEQMNQFRLLSFNNLTASRMSREVERELAGASREFRIVRDSEQIGTGNSKKLMVVVSWEFQNAASEHVIYTIKNR